ncbi:MAG: glycosyltransferase family protein [Desulfohalobiaceae bacterium]
MRILYGVQTTGNGHLVRSAALISALKEMGHSVYTLMSGDQDKPISQPEAYQPYESRPGLTFVTSNGRIRYLKTLRQLRLYRFYRDIRSFSARDFDLAVTDYEPLTSRIARRNKIPSIGVGHLYAFAHPVPLPKKDPLGVSIMRIFAPADIPLGLHWHHFDRPILPPTVPKDVYSKNSPCESRILVYFPFESLERIRDFLRPFREFTFHIYVPGLSGPSEEANLVWRPVSRKDFVEDLADCGGVMCNAGFSLISEALHVGRKVLAKPVSGQVEQKANALALRRLGLGWTMSRLDRGAVLDWLRLPSPEPRNYPDVLPRVAEWIHKGNWDRPQELADRLWS